MKKICVSFTFNHHKGTHAGYQHIAEYLDYDAFISCEKVMERLTRKRTFFSRVESFLMRCCFGFSVFPSHILKSITWGIKRNDIVFHFIHPENTYINFKRFIRKGNRVVLTIHQPYEWYQNKKWKARLRSADKIIVLSDSELSYFKKDYGNKVYFIPHGIDTQFYSPDINVSKEPLILTVGNWLRDYTFADKVYQSILKANDNIKVAIVSLPDNQKYITNDARIEFKSGISDEDLLMLYRKSAVVFLPLTEFTANNALLEAASCGCTIIIATNHGHYDYLTKESVVIETMDVKKISNLIINYAKEPQYRLSIHDYIDKNYSWNVIAKRVDELLLNN